MDCEVAAVASITVRRTIAYWVITSPASREVFLHMAGRFALSDSHFTKFRTLFSHTDFAITYGHFRISQITNT